MKNYRYLLYFIVTSLLLSSCLKEDRFGTSAEAKIKTFKVLGQTGDPEIDNDKNTIEIQMYGSLILEYAAITKLTLSPFASSNVIVGDVLDLTIPQTIIVTAEDGSEQLWTVTADVASSHPQLRNSGFNNWYQTSSGYFEPAYSEAINLLAPVWATNNGASHGIGLIPVLPLEVVSSDYATRLATEDNSLFSGLYGRITTGIMFTGIFSKLLSMPGKPASGIIGGVEFTGRPDSFSIQYQYQPGESNQDSLGNDLVYGDAAQIYVLLEVRNSVRTQRLATAWFRSQLPTGNLAETTIDFKYGPLDNSFPDYMFPENGDFVPKDSAQFVFPTHLVFMATPSFDGDNFAGAVGSVLIIDEFELQY